MFIGKANDDLNQLFLTVCKIRTDYFFVFETNLFTDKPEAEKPPLMKELNTLVVSEILDNGYVLSHKPVRNLCLQWTKTLLPFLNGFWNGQINPNSWGSMPPHNFDSTYLNYIALFMQIHEKIHTVLQQEGYIQAPQP